MGDSETPLRVGIFGLGTIGRAVAARLDQGIAGLQLVAVTSRDMHKAADAMTQFREPVPVVDSTELCERADVIVECAPATAFREIAEAALRRARIFVPLSVGYILQAPELIELARRKGARIIVPTGALLGLDAVRAAAEGEIHAVKVVTRKPPSGLAKAPYLAEQGIDVMQLSEPLKVFEGPAREGVAGFPANVNVVAALSLAGIGADRTQLEIWADPTLRRNTHRIDVEADSARFSLYIENVPSDENPATGRITALSVIACLRGLVSPFKVGS
ncbi:MAG: aspartate dehydrogenase [Gammaproteobacteria bacterium]|nr:aspartate dehydrogenase [Gammaproteobacteria bacterium]